MDLQLIKTFLLENWAEIKEIIASLRKCLEAFLGNANTEDAE